MNRRLFLNSSLTAVGRLLFNQWDWAANPGKYFFLGKLRNRWWLFTPGGKPFFALSLNHIDAGTLMYPENVNLWEGKYKNSMKRWLRKVGKDIRRWGFNSVGWVQEVIIRHEVIHQQSDLFTFEEYQWLRMPYCHRLPFTEFHHWDTEHRHPDFFNRAFEDWCDDVARRQCTRFRNDPNLIGYFYADCPAWVHFKEKNAWKGSLFDPLEASTTAGKKALTDMATRYYKVLYEAIRRYDAHHLILGDRYEASRPLSETVNNIFYSFIISCSNFPCSS